MIPESFRKFTTSSCSQIGGFSEKMTAKPPFLQSLSEMTSRSRVFAVKKKKNPLFSLMNRGKYGVMRFSHVENGFSQSKKSCHSGGDFRGLPGVSLGFLSAGILSRSKGKASGKPISDP